MPEADNASPLFCYRRLTTWPDQRHRHGRTRRVRDCAGQRSPRVPCPVLLEEVRSLGKQQIDHRVADRRVTLLRPFADHRPHPGVAEIHQLGECLPPQVLPRRSPQLVETNPRTHQQAQQAAQPPLFRTGGERLENPQRVRPFRFREAAFDVDLGLGQVETLHDRAHGVGHQVTGVMQPLEHRLHDHEGLLL